MIFVRNDLDKLTSQRIDLDEAVELDPTRLKENPRLLGLRDIFAVGHGYYDSHSSRLILDLRVEGIMTVPCAITLRPFDIEFSVRVDDMFSFDPLGPEDEGIEEVEGETLDLSPYFMDAIFAEVPLKAVHPDLETYPEGDGWVVMTEEDYINEKSQEIDPRLAKLKDFKFD
ncbi:DUF177 domain-containing protein [Erysipelothrix sp. HDW6B]|uniref:YceD family protein n=1 Tax=Erysipelothrix TaxID=1647 RepID=UPI001358D0BC|nr:MULTISPECIES: YceD family protein [Erysipelothrix]QIK86500.1 DUF177 domain-containing protein [Erysipelothrix sp. HDW6B]